MTDAHVVLGPIAAGALSGGITLDVSAAHRAIGELAAALEAAPERVARAMLDIADASVARALRRVSVERGVNPRDCVLVPFGGGGPLHACGLAEQLGMRTIFVPPHAGMLSALGLAITSERRERMASVLAPASMLDVAAVRAACVRAADGLAAEPGWLQSWTVRMRYIGQGHELDVVVENGDDGTRLTERFSAVHARRNGFTLDAPAEVIGIRYVVSGPAHPVRFGRPDGADPSTPLGMSAGPSVIALPGATLRIAPGWTGVAHDSGGWLLTHGETSA